MFDKVATWTADRTGSGPAFVVALAIVVAWILEGLVVSAARADFGYFLDDKYQLQINTFTTVVTFLLVVLLQYTGDKATEAIHTKLDVIIGALRGASDRMAGIEKMTADELHQLHQAVIDEIEGRGA